MLMLFISISSSMIVVVVVEVEVVEVVVAGARPAGGGVRAAERGHPGRGDAGAQGSDTFESGFRV